MTCQPEKALELLEVVGSLNREDPFRDGNLILLPDYGQVVMTGDLHGCETNFHRLRFFADLDRCPQRHVIIHELIHINNHDAFSPSCEDRSCQLLLEALEWKQAFPDQVHFVLGNHDLAQITGREITKSGAASIAAFNDWVRQTFGRLGDRFLDDLSLLLSTFALAARCPNRLWLSHSLPGPYATDTFDAAIFNREWQPLDLLPGGSIYDLVWGRGHTREQLDRLADVLDSDFFIVGHQGQPTGFDCQFDRMIILSSDHSQGCFMPIDLAKRYHFDDLTARIRYFHQIPAPQEESDV
jgi:hypothetical protein